MLEGHSMAQPSLTFAERCARGRQTVLDATRDPTRVQAELLTRIVERNATSAFGKEHGFARLRDVRDFQREVPIRTYAEARAWLDREAGGELGVVVSEPPVMFFRTAGT